MSELGIKAEVGIFNSIVAACAHSGEHARARAMFEAMPDHGCAPDAVTFANLIRAYKKVGRVQSWSARGLPGLLVAVGSS